MELNLRSDSRTSEPAAARNAPGPVIELSLRRAPSGRMTPAHLESPAKRLKRGFHVNDEIVAAPTRGAVERFYTIHVGTSIGIRIYRNRRPLSFGI